MKRVLAFLLAFTCCGAVLSAPLAASREGTEVEIVPAHLEISDQSVSLSREELARIGILIDDKLYESTVLDAEEAPPNDRVILTKHSVGFLLMMTSFFKNLASENFPYIPLIVDGSALVDSGGTEIAIIREPEDPTLAIDWKRQLRQPRNSIIKYFLAAEKAHKRIDGDLSTFRVVPRKVPHYEDVYRQVYSPLPTMTASK